MDNLEICHLGSMLLISINLDAVKVQNFAFLRQYAYTTDGAEPKGNPIEPKSHVWLPFSYYHFIITFD